MPNTYSFFQRYSIIKQIPLFSQLNFLELQRIARKARFVEYKKGDLIYRQGEPPSAFYCLVSGRIQAYTTSADGQKEDVEFIRRGVYFGVISLLTGEEHSLSFEAINDSLLMRIEKKDFDDILRSIPHLGVELSQSLSRRLRRKRMRVKSTFESMIISVYSPVKRAGSSTYAANLALSLERETSRKVLLVNIVVSGKGAPSAAQKSSKSEVLTWKDRAVPLKDVVDDYEGLMAAVTKDSFKIDLLHVDFDPQDTSLVSQISSFVTDLASDYRYVVVDLPNEMDDVVMKTLTQSDLVQLISDDQPGNLKSVRQVIYTMEEQLKGSFRVGRVQVLLSTMQEDEQMPFEEVNRLIDFDVLTRLPYISAEHLHEVLDSRAMSLRAPAPESDYARSVRAIARRIGGVQMALVLGGGAALGVAHIGVLRVLEKENIPIDLVVGSSMGALIASFWACGKNADEIEVLAREFTHKKALMKLYSPALPFSGGLVGGANIVRWMKKSGLRDKTFYDTKIPLKIVAYDLNHREDVVIGSGLITDALRKSIAIPGVITPVLERDRMIVDGGVLNPLPTNVPGELGVKKVIAVNVLQSPEDVVQGYLAEQKRLREVEASGFPRKHLHAMGRHLAKTTTRFDIIVKTLQATEHVIAEQSAHLADVVIHPPLAGIQWFELYKVDDLVQRGEAAAVEALPKILQLVKE